MKILLYRNNNNNNNNNEKDMRIIEKKNIITML